MSRRVSKRKPAYWFIQHPEREMRLCRDRKWRYHTPFGTESNCLLQYKRKGDAQNQANKCRVNGKTHIIAVYPGEIYNAAGQIVKE